MTRPTTTHAHDHEHIRETLARVEELNARATSRHQQIRVNHWVRKLLDQPVANPAWRKNVVEHASALLHMMRHGWEWERVWKGAFERLRREIKDKDTMIAAMKDEINELRAVTAAQKAVIDREKHLREATLQNEHLLRQRRREKEFPEGLLHDQLPVPFKGFRIYHSNLSALPDSLGPLWSNRRLISFDLVFTQIREIPASLQHLRSSGLAIVSSEIVSLPADLFASSELEYLWLSGNPLSQLPDSIGSLARLAQLRVERTNVTTLPTWLTTWLGVGDANAAPRDASLFGSPVCDVAALALTAACSTDRKSDGESTALPYVNEREASDMSVQGDPRRPREVHSFIREKVVDAPRTISYTYSTISLLLGTAAFILRLQWAAWLSFIFCVASFATLSGVDSDMKQMSWSIMTATSAIVVCYAGQNQITKAPLAPGASPIS
ncbi:hypothetical protein ATCC90586_007334 [Pythium insidiosum]|nr:hypothetical protein ATCC90586_007334 [Pythium insidiosum]